MSGFPLESMKQNWRTWPNLFSSLRIALSWLPAYLLVTGSQDATLRWWALIIFVLIAATDGVDGWLARKLNQTSEWGMFIDPIGDKLLVGFAFIALYAVRIEPKMRGQWSRVEHRKPGGLHDALRQRLRRGGM